MQLNTVGHEIKDLVLIIKTLSKDKSFQIHTAIILIIITLAFLNFPIEKPEAKVLVILMLITLIWGWFDGHNIFCLMLNHEKKYFDGLKAIFSESRSTLFTENFESSINNIMLLLEKYNIDQKEKGNYSGFHFFEVLTRTKQSKTIADTDSIEYLSNIRRDDIHMRLIHIRFAIWLIPTLGFIGTLLGMRNGLGHLREGLNDMDKMMEVISGFSTAFDATLYAIALSAILAFFLSCIEKKSDKFLVDMDNYLVNDILKLLPNPIISDFEKQMKDFEAVVDRSSGILESTISVLKQSVESISAAGKPIIDDTLDAGNAIKNDMAEISENLKTVLSASTEQIKVLHNAFSQANTKDADWQSCLGNLHNIANEISDYLKSIDRGQKQSIETLINMESHISKLSGTLSVSLDAEQINGFIKGVMKDINQISAETRNEYIALLGLQEGDSTGNTLLGCIGDKLESIVNSIDSSTIEVLGIGNNVTNISKHIERLDVGESETVILSKINDKLESIDILINSNSTKFSDIGLLLVNVSKYIQGLDKNTNNIITTFEDMNIEEKVNSVEELLKSLNGETISSLDNIVETLAEFAGIFTTLNQRHSCTEESMVKILAKLSTK